MNEIDDSCLLALIFIRDGRPSASDPFGDEPVEAMGRLGLPLELCKAACARVIDSGLVKLSDGETMADERWWTGAFLQWPGHKALNDELMGHLLARITGGSCQ